jgi:hypothetical protein
MGSSYAETTFQMLSRGLRYEPGSMEDTFARIGLETERRVEYIKTLAIVNAIISVGNHVVAAITQSPGDAKGGDSVTKTLEALKEMLLPEDKERTESKAQRARRVLEEEATKGPIKFRTMDYGKPKKGRVKLKV